MAGIDYLSFLKQCFRSLSQDLGNLSPFDDQIGLKLPAFVDDSTSLNYLFISNLSVVLFFRTEPAFSW